MAVYRLMDGQSGRPGVGSSGTQPPATPTGFSGNFEVAECFAVTQGGMWFEGYWWWVPGGGDTGPQKFCLYSLLDDSPQTGNLVPGATVTSGTLTAGAFNFIPLPQPVQLSIGTISSTANGSGLYNAQTAWAAVNGFPESLSQFGATDPYPDGFTNGPLASFGSQNAPGHSPAASSAFGTASSDPTTGIVGSTNNALFWLDIQVTDTQPAGYAGTYRLYPNRADWNGASTADAAVNYVIAIEIHLSQACTLNRIWYYSPAGTVQLATRAGVYSITGADSGAEVAAIASPSWSGTAGSGWVGAPFAGGVTLGAGVYKAYVYNGAASPDQWGAKDSATSYWTTGEGANGITWGPLYAPPLASASTAYIYDPSGGGNTPPFSNGSGGTEAGQCTFAVGPPSQYPYLYVDGLAQNYWIDLEVTLPGGTGPAYTASMSSM